MKIKTRKPEWLKRPLPRGPEYEKVRHLLAGARLTTVCQEAKCPNMWECFSRHTATFMILGSQCTRNCRFCNVTPGAPPLPDPQEPKRVARAALELGLSYVVVTSVTRDDLPDGGAGHFAATIHEIKTLLPENTRVEVLIPDFMGDAKALQQVMDAHPDVLNHNIETVPALYHKARPEANYQRSLTLLHRASRMGKNSMHQNLRPYQAACDNSGNSDTGNPPPQNSDAGTPNTHNATVPDNAPVDAAPDLRPIPIKSGIMVGLGETREELEQTIRDLNAHGCDILTIGQYLQPSRDHLPVAAYYTPEEFKQLETFAKSVGFTTVAAGPFVRSSYKADQLCPGSGKIKESCPR